MPKPNRKTVKRRHVKRTKRAGMRKRRVGGIDFGITRKLRKGLNFMSRQAGKTLRSVITSPVKLEFTQEPILNTSFYKKTIVTFDNTKSQLRGFSNRINYSLELNAPQVQGSTPRMKQPLII